MFSRSSEKKILKLEHSALRVMYVDLVGIMKNEGANKENHSTWVIMRFSLDKKGGEGDGSEEADGLSLKSTFRMRERT